MLEYALALFYIDYKDLAFKHPRIFNISDIHDLDLSIDWERKLIGEAKLDQSVLIVYIHITCEGSFCIRREWENDSTRKIEPDEDNLAGKVEVVWYHMYECSYMSEEKF